MTILRVGGEADCFEPVSGQAFAFDSTGGHFDANASRNALLVTQAVSEIQLPIGSNVTEVWIHAKIYQEAQANDDYIYIKSAAGGNAYRIRVEADGDWTISLYTGAAWSDLATSTLNADVVANELYNLDIYLLINGTTGEFTVYKNGASVVTFTGDTLGDEANVGLIHFRGFTGGAADMSVSQVIVATTSTIDKVLMTHHATGAGTTTDWPTGTYADIDETGYSNSDFISTPDVNDVDTFAAADINAAWTNYTVDAVVVAMRGRIDALSPVSDVQAAVRSGGTNYVSSNLSLTNDGNEHSVQSVFSTDPNTASAWSQSGVNAMEIGVKAV